MNAIICWDFAVIQLAKKLGIEIHISTQASIANSETAEFYRKLGATRVVLARECSLEQIKEIKKHTKVEIEIFIHGAMCVSMSGRCFMSQFLYGKSANRGECQQPCRKKYFIRQVDDQGKELELGEDYVMSPKDMRTIDFIEKILDLGVDCLKIEGRNRSPEYVATVTKSYRTIIDFIYAAKKRDKQFQEDLAKLKGDLIFKLNTVYHRGNSSGFFLGKPINEWAGCPGSQATERKIYIGKVIRYYPKIKVAEILIQQSNGLKINDRIIIQGPSTGSIEEKITSLEKDHQIISKGEKGERVAIKVSTKVRPKDEVYFIKSCNSF